MGGYFLFFVNSFEFKTRTTCCTLKLIFSFNYGLVYLARLFFSNLFLQNISIDESKYLVLSIFSSVKPRHDDRLFVNLSRCFVSVANLNLFWNRNNSGFICFKIVQNPRKIWCHFIALVICFRNCCFFSFSEKLCLNSKKVRTIFKTEYSLIYY